MYKDFKESIILLVQHPIMNKPISDLTQSECEQAYELMKVLSDLSVNEKYTKLDYFQMARLEFQLGDLAYKLGKDWNDIITYYQAVPRLLEKGGFDLSMKKWVDLVGLRTKE